MKRLFFVCGFPRSFSTVFTCLMQQHPEVYATATSPALAMILNAAQFFTSREEFKAWEPNLAQKAYSGFVKSGLAGFYAAQTDKPVVLDKNRDAILYGNVALHASPGSKFIFIVRDLQGICSSYEKKIEANPAMAARFNPAIMANKVARFVAYTSSPEISEILSFTRDFDFEGNRNNVLILRGEDLLNDHTNTLKKVCSFMEIPEFQFDVNNIEQIYENDLAYRNIVADHQVRRQLRPIVRERDENVDAELRKLYPYFYQKFGY